MSIRKLAGGFVLSTAVALGAASAWAATLPSGYTEVEYVESSGSQNLNTGIAPKTTTRLVCDFQYTTSGIGLCGWGSNGNKESFFFGVSSEFKASVSGNWTQSSTGVAADTARHTFDLSMSALKFDGTAFANASASPFANASSGNTLHLFALHQGWSPNVGNYSNMRIFSCQIYDGDTLVRDFVPAVRGSDDKAGLYDLVSESFFGGTGDLTAGPEPGSGDITPPASGARIPEGYTEIEFIKGNGSNARIVTDYVPTPNADKIEAVVSFPTLDKAMTIWCARGSSTTTASWTMFMLNDSGYKLRLDYGSVNNKYFAPTLSANTKYMVTAEGNVGTWTNGTGVTHTKVADFTAGGPVTLFASYVNGTGNSVDNWGKHRLYSFKVWRSNKLIHYFVPCKDSSGNATMVDICANPATLTREGVFTPGTDGHYYDDSLFSPWQILPIPNQYCLPNVMPAPGFTLTNVESGVNWTFAEGGVATNNCPFEASYSYDDGVGTVTVTGKAGEGYEGVTETMDFLFSNEILVNGGFESGTLSPGWTGTATTGNSSSGFKPNNTTTFISGTYCGIIQQSRYAQQVFTVSSTCRATLSWKCKHRCDWNSGTPMYYSVLLDGEVIYPEEKTTGSDVLYRSIEDLVLEPGEHTLKFQGRTDNNADSTLFLDDVSLHVVTPLVILPIPNQNCAEGPCRPEFVVSNMLNGSTVTAGGDIVSADFDVAYTNNTSVGTAAVTATGKGAYAGLPASATFGISEDEFVSTSDLSVRRINVGGDVVYVFTNASELTTLTTKRSLFLTDALVVGGGGAGGINFGGGGGGGGVLALDDVAIAYDPGETISFSIGAGGRPSTATAAGHGRSGGNSVITLGGITYTAKGGGGGGNVNQQNGLAGGSGGGATKNGVGGAGTAGQGYAGAAGSGNSLSGGGGGAGHAGYLANTTDNRAGNGGEGATNDITGVWTYYGGGGGGGGSASGWGTANPGYGGLGGGGDGGKNTVGQNGADGFGGGGGGAGYNGDCWGSIGGTGTVILRFKTNDFEIDPVPAQYLAAGASTPDPVVRSGGTLLTKGDDYTVAYSDNTAPGTATMTITGIGTYAGKVGYASFTIATRYFLKPAVAAEGDGSSWADAMSVTNFFATYGVISNRCEVWIAAGTVPAAALTATVNAPFVVRGGFAGTETTLAERPSGTLTVFDGKVGNTRTSSILLSVENAALTDLVLERLKFCNAKSNGFVKTGGGSLKLLDCAVEANGRDVGKSYGRGMNVQSDGYGSLVVSNCVFAGNRNITQGDNYGGFGIYIVNFKEALVDKSLFVTNGFDILTPEGSVDGHWGWCGANAKGSSIYANNTPITVRDCRFAGNVCPLNAGMGGVIYLAGASGGSVIDHCAFIGNSEHLSYQAGSSGLFGGAGALVVNLANSTDKVSVNNCTFAYNVTGAGYSAGGISVVTGDVDIDNTIFWKNARYNTTTIGYGLDVQVGSSGTARIRHSTVTTLDGTSLGAVNPESLVVDPETVIALDPKLVTTTEAFTNLLTVTSSKLYYRPGNPTRYEDLASMDAHLRSPTGYFVNGGAAGPATSDYSAAIDFGDSAADYSNEPAPNGSRLNAGAYGNTAEASSTAIGQPEANVAVTFPDGLTRPKVTITMGLESGDGYSATVQVYCSTGGVFLGSQTFKGVINGDVLEYILPHFLANGDNFNVLVTINAPSSTQVEYQKSETVEGSYPPYYGKGGGPNVIHVRTGANCLMNGTSWTDAYPDLLTALASAPAENITEVWLAVTNDYMNRSVTLGGSLMIRGGFKGVENSPDDRVEGDMAWLDGNNAYRTLDFVVPATATLTVERVRFAHSSQSELKKTGAGDLVIRDCLFTDGNTAGMSGRGLYVEKGTLTVSNCKFLNLIGPNEQNADGGNGIFMSGCTAAYVDDCLFATNGTAFKADGSWCRHQAAAVRVNSTPAIFRNCRFSACAAALREADVGGIVYFSGASGGSKMINCTLVGNTDSRSQQIPASTITAGAIAVIMSTTNATLDVENCTVAYNLSQAERASAGITVRQGTVNLKNSIVYGNVRGRKNNELAGSDIHVRPDGHLNISYTLVTGLSSNYVAASEGGTINYGPGVLSGVDPLLMTTTNDFWKLFKSDSAYWYMDTAAARDACAAFDVHPRTHTGYFKDGVLIRDPERVESPTIDAGDPESDYSKEPVVSGVGYHGRRVNLGFSGNTPEAALTAIPGFSIILR